MRVPFPNRAGALRLVAAAAALGAGVLAACGGDASVPGDEVIGRFAFTAQMAARGCGFQEVPEGERFEFSGILSRDTGGGGAFLTVGSVNRDGAWDGQRFDSTATSQRRFETEKERCDNRYSVEERLHVAVLSQSQDASLGGACPEDPAALLADGAVPVDEAGGVLPPGPRDLGYDAVRACGLVSHRVQAVNDCDGQPVDCTMTWRVEGVRRQ